MSVAAPRIEAGDVSNDDLAAVATRLRVKSIEMADRAGPGHPTSSMSAADLIAVLVGRHFRIDADRQRKGAHP